MLRLLTVLSCVLFVFINLHKVRADTVYANDFNSIKKFFKEFSDLFNGVNEKDIDAKTEVIQRIVLNHPELSVLPNGNKLADLIDKIPFDGPNAVIQILLTNVNVIDSWYKDFEVYFKSTFHHNKINYDFNKFKTNHMALIKDANKAFGVNLANDFNPDIFDLIYRSLKLKPLDELCTLNESTQHFLYKIYSSLILTEIRTNILLVQSYIFDLNYQIKVIQNELILMGKNVIIKCEAYAKFLVNVMYPASRRSPTCDNPVVNGRVDGYIELSKSIQKLFVMEPDLTEGNVCTSTCEDIKESRTFDHSNPNYYRSMHRCNGKAVECSSAHRNSPYNICEMPKGDMKRYDWIQAEQSSYGAKPTDDKCQYTDLQRYVKGWPTSLFWYCDICVCDCIEEDADSTAIRTISLMPQHSHKSANMVVTDVRFIEKDKMIHIQIKEGQLMPYGHILKESERWVDVGDFKYDSTTGKFSRTSGNSFTVELQHGVDYSFVKANQRTIITNNIPLKYYHVVTGVRFQYLDDKSSTNNTKNSLILQVEATEVDFETGKLQITTRTPSYWYYIIREKSGKYFFFDDHNEEHSDTVPVKEIQFKASKLTSFDAGQMTLPFFDSSPINPTEAMPLSGLALTVREHNEEPLAIGFEISHYNIVHSFLNA